MISYRYRALHKHTFLLDDEQSLHTTHIYMYMSSLCMYRLRLTFINMSAAWHTQRQHVFAIPASQCLHRVWKEKPFLEWCLYKSKLHPALSYGSLWGKGQNTHEALQQSRKGMTKAQNPITGLNYCGSCVVKSCLTTHSSSPRLCKHNMELGYTGRMSLSYH